MGHYGGSNGFDTRAQRKVSGQYGIVRKQYAGWIQIEQSMFDRFDEYTAEDFLLFDGGWITVQQVRYSQPVEIVWTTDKRCYAFDLALNERPKATTASIRGCGTRAEPASIGRVLMVPPDQTIRYAGSGGHCRTMRCFLDAELIERYLPEKPVWSSGRLSLQNTLTIGGGEIEWLLRRMYRELSNPDFASTGMIEALAKQLAVEVIRSFELRESGDRFHAGGLAPWRMRLISERVYADEPAPSVGELAGLCDMTVRHLSRAFRIETGKTIGKFVEGALIERANEKLLRGLPVGEVATSLGYATSGSFATAFRRATGILPSEVKVMARTQ